MCIKAVTKKLLKFILDLEGGSLTKENQHYFHYCYSAVVFFSCGPDETGLKLVTYVPVSGQPTRATRSHLSSN